MRKPYKMTYITNSVIHEWITTKTNRCHTSKQGSDNAGLEVTSRLRRQQRRNLKVTYITSFIQNAYP